MTPIIKSRLVKKYCIKLDLKLSIMTQKAIKAKNIA
jgi:hypothetical protein